MKRLLLFCTLISTSFLSFSQADNCDQATYLPDVTDFCTPNAFYTNVGSTASGFSTASCWAATSTNDVWFTFIATGTDLLGSVSGVGGGGTINRPKIALYSGSCAGTLNELACTNNNTTGISQIYEGGMIPGNSYLLRVSSNPGHVGTFKLCINNYTPAASPGADCDGATNLCSKSTIGVAQLSGGGVNTNEPNADAGSCMTGSAFSPAESNSVWYTWTCGASGTLTFDITPIDPLNDIDYVLYSLAGTDPCGGRTIVRCNTSSCLGPANVGLTGLNTTDADVSENPGCEAGEDAYCQFINMTTGVSYALLINNANGSSGFNLSWGGSGTFQGPDPVINSSNTTICSGETIQFDGSGSTNVGGGLSWIFSDGTTIQNETGAGPFTIPFNTSGNYVAILNGTSALGCQETEVANIIVDDCNGCTVTAGNSGNVCPGATFNLTATTVTDGTYSWTGPNGYTSSSQNPTGITASATPGTYTFTVTVTTPTSTCTASTTVTVNSLPVVGGGADQSVCQGSSIILSGSGANTYTWNNGISDGAAFTPASTQTYTVTGTAINGCQNTDQVLVTVNPLPAVSAGPDQTVCQTTAVTLSGSGAASFLWNNGIVNGVAFTPAGTLTYTVTGTSAAGCTNTDQVTVNVNPAPVVSAGSDQSVCIGSPVVLSAGGATTYTWNNGVSNSVPFTPSSTQTYTVTGTITATGCQSTDQVVVTVNPLPTVNAGADETYCLGTSVILSGTGAVNYTWTGGVMNGISFSPGLGTTTYTLTGTDANGCQNTDVVTLTVLPFPIASIIPSGELTGYPGLAVDFGNDSQFADQYSWVFGNGQTAETADINTSYEIVYTAPGSYEAILTASNGYCEDTSAVQIIVIPFPPAIVHIPNVFTPDGDGVNDYFFIDVEFGTSINVSIFNRWGNHITDITDLNGKWDGTINGNQADDATYFFTYSITGIDGNTSEGHGFVELIR